MEDWISWLNPAMNMAGNTGAGGIPQPFMFPPGLSGTIAPDPNTVPTAPLPGGGPAAEPYGAMAPIPVPTPPVIPSGGGSPTAPPSLSAATAGFQPGGPGGPSVSSSLAQLPTAQEAFPNYPFAGSIGAAFDPTSGAVPQPVVSATKGGGGSSESNTGGKDMSAEEKKGKSFAEGLKQLQGAVKPEKPAVVTPTTPAQFQHAGAIPAQSALLSYLNSLGLGTTGDNSLVASILGGRPPTTLGAALRPLVPARSSSYA